MNITITMKDGTVRDFPHQGRPGGSYSKRIHYEGAFAIVEDEYGCTTAIPAADILEVKTWPERW